MKRSEMIEIIAEDLLKIYGGAEDEWNQVREETQMWRLRMASIALKAVEKTGLLPHWTDRGEYEKE